MITALQKYYSIKDLDECTNFLGIFNALYVDNVKLSYDEVAAKFYISINTLKRYIKKFNSLAEKLLKVK